MQKFSLVGDLVNLCLSNIKTDRHTYIPAMEILFIEQFIQDENFENYKPEVISSLIDSFTREDLQLVLKDKSILNLIKMYKKYEDKIYKGHLGKTHQVWCLVL